MFALWADRRPKDAVIALALSLAIFPVYLVPDIQALSPQPTMILAFVLALVLLGRYDLGRFTAIDGAFVAFSICIVAASLLGPPKLLSTASDLLLWVAPYAAGRVICVMPRGVEFLAIGCALAGLVAIPSVLYEAVTHVNPFFGLANSGSRFTDLWARHDFRGMSTFRTEGPFGHPLTLAFVMSTSAVFAVALGVRARQTSWRVFWFLAALALMLVQSTSNARTGWLLFLAGVALFAAAAIPRGSRLKHGFAIAVVGIPLAVAALSLSAGSDESSRLAEQDSAEHRAQLYERALEPGALQPFGSQQSANFNAFVNPVRPGSTAIDSAYLATGDQYGVFSLLALIAVTLAVIVAAFRTRGRWEAVLPAVALAQLTVLTVVGFQSQVPFLAWLVVGGVAGCTALLPRRGTAPLHSSSSHALTH